MTTLSKLLFACGATACGATASRPSAPDASVSSRDRCAMIEAAFRLDAFRTFACGTAATRNGRILVDVTPPVSCTSRVFAIYRAGEPTNTDALLQLTIGPYHTTTWAFSATYIDPPSSPDDALKPDGSFDDVSYYCAFGFGRLERSEDAWRAWVAAPSERR